MLQRRRGVQAAAAVARAADGGAEGGSALQHDVRAAVGHRVLHVARHAVQLGSRRLRPHHGRHSQDQPLRLAVLLVCGMLTPLLPCRHLRCSLSSRHAQSSAENLFFNGPRLHPLPAVRSWWRAPMDLPLHQKLLLATLNEPCIFDFSPRIFHKVFLLSGEALARPALSLSSRIARFPLLRLRACCLSVCHAVYVCVGECVWGRARCVFSGDRESAMCPQPASESRASWARCCRAR